VSEIRRESVYWHREIRVPEVERIGTSQVSKSQRNQDRPSEEDAWQQSRAIGERPDRRSSSKSRFGDIGSPGTRCLHFRIANPETPKGGKDPSWEPAVSISEKWKVPSLGASCQHSGESGFEESGIPWAYAFWHWKPRNPDEG
jgi:hypothetical protein